MATRQATVSLQFIDAAGKTTSMPVYVTFDDATATLSSIAAAVATLIDEVDDVTDCQVTKASYTINQAVPGSGIKTAPVAGSNVQETGLFTFPVLGSNYKIGIAVPGVAAAIQDQGVIPISGVAEAFTDRVMATGGTLAVVEPISLHTLGEVRSAVVTFRKHG